MEIKCIVTDDEPIAREGMKEYIGKVDFLKLIGECEDAFQLNSLLQTTQPDLLLLDIQMPDLTGIDLLSAIPHPPKVIFTTAYEQYAVKGFELNATDYLLKPISFERFLKAVNRVHDELQKEKNVSGDDYFFIKRDKQIKKIRQQEILYLESMENYVAIHTLDSREIVYSTLKHIYTQLSGSTFLQVHRSYIVNMEYIESIEGNMLHIRSARIPIARALRKKVFETILNNRLLNK